MKPQLIFATHNKHKLEEVKAILGDRYELLGLDDIHLPEAIAETGDTLEANAFIKARSVFERTHKACFSDDSGLEVEALKGAPGVYSARYAGEEGNHGRNMEKLLYEMKDKENRKARFRTVICYLDDIGTDHYFSGIINGTISDEKKGGKGFGYDPVFVPEGYELTFAQMDPEQKNKISHRALAVQKFTSFLLTL